MNKIETEPDNRSFVTWLDPNGDPYAVWYRKNALNGYRDDHWWNADQYDEGTEENGISWADLLAEMEGFDGPFLLVHATPTVPRTDLERYETAVMHMLALAPDEYRQCIVAARASASPENYALNNGRAEMIRVFATGLAERAGLPVTDWEQIKRDVPSDGVYRKSAGAS